MAVKFLSVFAIFAAAAWYKAYDPDFGWHLQAGNIIRESGIPSYDIFTYTASHFRWIDHEWMSDVFVSLLFGWFGYTGLVFVYAFLWTCALFIAKAYKRFTLLVIAALAMIPYAGVRATTWTVLCLSILLALSRSRNRRLTTFIPVLMLFWANVHGGFFIGLVVIAYYLVMERKRKWALVLAASVLATFINPYGPRLYEEVFRTIFDSSVRWQIAEWFPASFLLFVMPFIYSLVWAIGFVLNFDKKKWKQQVFDLAPLFFLASLSSNRHFPLFVIVSSGNIAEPLRRVKSLIPKNIDWKRRVLVLSLPALIGFFTIWELYAMAYRVTTYGNVRELSYPQKAVAYLQNNPCPGNIFNNYNYGGYLIWKLPGTLLYIDGRLPHWHDPDGVRYFDRYHRVVIDQNAANNSDFDRYGIKCVLWSNDAEKPPLIQSIERAKWRKIDEASGANYSLWVAPEMIVDKPLPKF